MKVRKSFSFGTSTPFTGDYDEPTECPLCHHAIKPVQMMIKDFKNDEGSWFISAFYLCQSCYQTFLTFHSCAVNAKAREYQSKMLYEGPQKYIPKTFDPMIESLSPMFVKIYNQAFAAETDALDEIAGLGYRKAMEFLIKDFCIHNNPDDTDKIKVFPLAKCIQTYIDNPQIQTLATKAAWLGNDEAHYVRKHSDRDVQDMKRFIQATVYFVGMSLIAEDAETISRA